MDVPGNREGPGLRVATLAAVVATCSDGMLLYVVNARRPELALAPPPPGTLAVGTVLGALAIAFYVLGYRGIAGMLRGHAPGRARAVQLAGSIGAMIGAAIHGVTGGLIARDLEVGAPAAPPFEAMMAWQGSPIPVLWLVATSLVVVASLAMARGAGEGGWPLTARVFNPVVLTVAIGMLGLGSELGRSFLTPAAPNVAHALCFAWATRVAASRPPMEYTRVS